MNEILLNPHNAQVTGVPLPPSTRATVAPKQEIAALIVQSKRRVVRRNDAMHLIEMIFFTTAGGVSRRPHGRNETAVRQISNRIVTWTAEPFRVSAANTVDYYGHA